MSLLFRALARVPSVYVLFTIRLYVTRAMQTPSIEIADTGDCSARFMPYDLSRAPIPRSNDRPNYFQPRLVLLDVVLLDVCSFAGRSLRRALFASGVATEFTKEAVFCLLGARIIYYYSSNCIV